jgi:hypothetical protein
MADAPSGRIPAQSIGGEMHRERQRIASAIALDDERALAEHEQTLSDADGAAAAERDRAATQREPVPGARR